MTNGTKGSGPAEPDFEKLEAGLLQQGLPLEADAYTICRRLDWNVVHAATYRAEGSDGATVWREIDVHAWKRAMIANSTEVIEHLMTVAIECKYATNWWVLVDIGGGGPRNHDFVFPPPPVQPSDPNTAAFVINVVRHEGGHVDPLRTTSYRELNWDCEKRPKQPQIQSAFRQILSARHGLGIESHTLAMAKPHPTVQHLVGVILTNRQPVVARLLEDASRYEYEMSDWIIHGTHPEVVHIVTPDGLNQLLTFLDAVIEGLRSPAAVLNLQNRIEKAREQD